MPIVLLSAISDVIRFHDGDHLASRARATFLRLVVDTLLVLHLFGARTSPPASRWPTKSSTVVTNDWSDSYRPHSKMYDAKNAEIQLQIHLQPTRVPVVIRFGNNQCGSEENSPHDQFKRAFQCGSIERNAHLGRYIALRTSKSHLPSSRRAMGYEIIGYSEIADIRGYERQVFSNQVKTGRASAYWAEGRLLVEQLRDFPNGDHDALEMALRLAGRIQVAPRQGNPRVLISFGPE